MQTSRAPCSWKTNRTQHACTYLLRSTFDTYSEGRLLGSLLCAGVIAPVLCYSLLCSRLVHGNILVHTTIAVAVYRYLGRTLRVPARNGYPSYVGARTLPYPMGNAISATGYPFFCRVPGYHPAFFLKFFLPTALPRRMKFELKIVRTTIVVRVYRNDEYEQF